MTHPNHDQHDRDRLNDGGLPIAETTTPLSQVSAADALKYAAALIGQRAEWTTSAIGGCDCGADHDLELGAIVETSREITAVAAGFGDLSRYSDGRRVLSSREIAPGLVAEHIWHPDPAAEKPRSYRGTLGHDPGEPCPGLYEVETDPATQELHVRVVRTA